VTEWAHLWRRNGLAPWRLCRVTLQPCLLKTLGACNISLLHFWTMQSSLGRWERSRSGGDGNSSGTTEEPADDLVLGLFVLCRVSSVKSWQITMNSILLLSCTHTFRLYHHRIRRHSSVCLLTTHRSLISSLMHMCFFWVAADGFPSYIRRSTRGVARATNCTYCVKQTRQKATRRCCLLLENPCGRYGRISDIHSPLYAIHKTIGNCSPGFT
jgi:hypothetical protein